MKLTIADLVVRYDTGGVKPQLGVKVAGRVLQLGLLDNVDSAEMLKAILDEARADPRLLLNVPYIDDWPKAAPAPVPNET